MAVSAGGERRKLGCTGKAARYGLKASGLSQSVNCLPFRLFVHLFAFVGTEHHKCTVYIISSFFRTERIVPSKCSQLWTVIKYERIQMVTYLTVIHTNNTE